MVRWQSGTTENHRNPALSSREPPLWRIFHVSRWRGGGIIHPCRLSIRSGHLRADEKPGVPGHLMTRKGTNGPAADGGLLDTIIAAPDAAISRLRAQRPEIVRHTQGSHDVLLSPADPGRDFAGRTGTDRAARGRNWPGMAGWRRITAPCWNCGAAMTPGVRRHVCDASSIMSRWSPDDRRQRRRPPWRRSIRLKGSGSARGISSP